MDFFTIYDLMYEKYKITKPIRMIELFAGYGSQALALKYLGSNFEHWKICEWAIPSIIAYADLHKEELVNYGKDFCQDLTKEQIAAELYNKGVSIDYNKPANIHQLNCMPEETLRLAFNSIKWENNLVDISKAKAKDLSIKDTKNYTYLLTYSFPCQDLSLAGKRKGMANTSTRSGLLWEVERILDECEELPQVLLMENVSQVHQTGNKEHFNKWQLKLEKLGYQNYTSDLSATEYGIPQTRVRTFMVSILNGNNNEKYNFTFPKKVPLKLRLKDIKVPESQFTEKFLISDKMIKGMINTNFESYKLENKLLDLNGVANTLLARYEGAPQCIQVKNATKKGYLEATDGDGIDISSRMKWHRGNVQKDKIQTLTTSGGNMITLTTRANTIGITTKDVFGNLAIRKLTPKECFRLMGMKDEDIEKIMKHQTNAKAYHLAGDSIVTTCLMAIFGEMLGIDWKVKFNPKEWWKNE